MDRCPLCNRTGRPMVRNPHETTFADYFCIECSHSIQDASGMRWFDEDVKVLSILDEREEKPDG